MRMLRSTLSVVLAAFAVAGAAGQQSSNSSPATAPQVAAPVAAAAPDSTAPTSIPSYPDTAKGLENLVKDMLKLEMGGQQQELERYEESLTLPNAEQWFKSVFGEALGGQVAAVSAPSRAAAEKHTGGMLAAERKEKRTHVEVVRFDDSCNLQATATEYPFLLLRQKPEHLYDVRFQGSSQEAVWAYFAYVDGGFRFIGNMHKKELGIREERPPDASHPRFRIGGAVMEAKAIQREAPVYPSAAKAAGLQGTVILHAIIARDGSVQNLYLNEGQCLLAESAMEAVRKWRYRPTTLDGKPVEVDTTIQVVYTLGR